MSNFKYTFFDNQLIGVDHLNEITKRLVSGGISAVYSGADFNVSEINDSNMALLTGGVVPGDDLNLKVTPLGSGRFLINQGICFFDDGTSMEVLSGGEEIYVTPGNTMHIYLTSDKNQMKCYPEISISPKQTGMFVYLGIINSDGTVTDKRTYAKGKVPGFYASTENVEVNVTKTFKVGEVSNGMTIEIPVGNGNFKHLLMEGSFPRYGHSALVYCEFENGEAVNAASYSAEGGANGMYIFNNYFAGNLKAHSISLKDGKLIIYASGYMGREGEDAIVKFHLW